jgi:glycosyltransferase involved in cell wall biosynthesis
MLGAPAELPGVRVAADLPERGHVRVVRSTLRAMSRAPDVAIVSLGTTLGWRYADEALAGMLESLGCSCEIVRVSIGRAGRLRRTMAGVDLVEALAARHAAARVSASAIVFSSVTAALLQRPPRVPYAVRFDTLAALSRPGLSGAWQRWREPVVLARARLLLPWSGVAARTADAVIASARGGAGASCPRIVTLPPPIELVARSGRRDLTAVAYAADPDKRGLGLLCEAWGRARPPDGMLVVGGIDRDRAEAWLARADVAEPAGITWAGALSRPDWLAVVGRARVFVNASRYEDWGVAQLEALALGTPLVTVPTPGPNEALELARRLDPRLVAPERTADALATAVTAGLSLNDAERDVYAAAAQELLVPYRPDAVRSTVAREVIPVLLGSSS